MFAVPLSGCDPLYALAPDCWYGYECCRELNFPSPPVLAYLLSYIVDETDLREVLWEISDSEHIVPGLASFLACALEGPGS